MNRRDFLVGILQALFLALFPWLRTERGAAVLRAGVDEMVPGDLDYAPVTPDIWTEQDVRSWQQIAEWHMARAYSFRWAERARA